MKKRIFVSLALGIALLSNTASAFDFSVSYGENDYLRLNGKESKSADLSITVAPSSDAYYSEDTDFAVIKELSPVKGGDFSFRVKMPPSAKSGYYDVAVYDAAEGEKKETFFFCNPAKAAAALSKLGSDNISYSDLKSNSDSLGITEDLKSCNSEILIKYINQFKGSAALDAMDFTCAYLSALLCGGKQYSYEEFTDTLQNNAYALGIAEHPYLSYSEDKQKPIFQKITSFDLSAKNFSDAIYETDFLVSLSAARAKEDFTKTVFDDFEKFLNLDTTDYDALKSPENVIISVMSSEYKSRDAFVSAFEAAVAEQKSKENKKTQGSSGGSSSAPSSQGSYSGSIASSPSGGTQTPQSPAGTAIFTDIAGHWSKEAVMYLKEKGIVDGIGNNLYDPERYVTRSEFSKMIAEALYKGAQDATGEFTDVSDSDWFSEYVYALSARGIINGTGDGRFSPYAAITRQDAAVIIARAAKSSGISLEASREANSFEDLAQVADYALESVDTLYKAELINGVSAARFDPLSGVSRAQAAQMIYNLLIK